MKFLLRNKQQAGRTGLLPCICLLLVGLAISLPAHANSFTVQPIRVELSAERQVFALRVRNTSQQPVSIQLDVKAWQQERGSDIYTDTRELLAVPPIFTVAANETQTIRVGLRRAPDQEKELSYRLYLRELPAANTSSSGVRMALNVGVPVFVKPASGHARHELEWSSSLNEAGERVLSVTNHGNGHAQITRLQSVASDFQFNRSLNAYVLPGASRSWVLPAEFSALYKDALEIKARVNGNELSPTVPMH